MRNQNFFGQDFVELRQRAHREAGTVHKSLRLQQAQTQAAKADMRDIAVKTRFRAQYSACVARDCVDDPETGVMARCRIFPAWIAKTGDQLDHITSLEPFSAACPVSPSDFSSIRRHRRPPYCSSKKAPASHLYAAADVSFPSLVALSAPASSVAEGTVADRITGFS